MLKKTVIISFVLCLISSIVFVALIPLATADTISMANNYHKQYAVQTELLNQPAEGINSVKLTGDWISDLEVRSSSDGNIHVITDGYRIRPITKLTPTIDQNGTLLVDIKMDQSTAINTDFANFFRAALAEINNHSHNYILLELPNGIEFISGSPDDYNYGSLDIDDDILVNGDDPICPVCGDSFCVDEECREELEEWLEERAEHRAERIEERAERRAERMADRAERILERTEYHI